jgi:hypothetical protein
MHPFDAYVPPLAIPLGSLGLAAGLSGGLESEYELGAQALLELGDLAERL